MCIRGKVHRNRIYFWLITKIKNSMNSEPLLIRRELDIEKYHTNLMISSIHVIKIRKELVVGKDGLRARCKIKVRDKSR